MKIGLLSDTHSFLDDQIKKHLKDCDEVWHAGDFGSKEVAREIEKDSLLRGVYGNIDGLNIRTDFKKDVVFEIDNLKIWMTHIGGYPPNYTAEIRAKIDAINPGLFICGHSHILKVINDKKRGILHINPGAAGHYGLHIIRTIVKFEIIKGIIKNLVVIELGKRGK